MKKLALLLPLFALAACGQEPSPEQVPAQTAAPEPIETLPPPDQALFSEVFAATCPAAEPVNTSVCTRAGLGSDEVICEFGLGEDTYLRHTATLTAGEGEWVLGDAEGTCP